MRCLIFALGLLALLSCSKEYTPKPLAYARIELPEPSYIAPNPEAWTCPYTFEASRLSYVTVDPKYKNETCWYNIYYPSLKATLHLTYAEVHDDLGVKIEDNRKLAMKHIGKATQINERLIEIPDEHVYGIAYDFRGETASDFQFFVTDSTQHFLRGSLYFNVTPNKDSLAPVIEYVKADIDHLIETLRWIQ
ncbi:MAG: gliding motility lipoprotein GldD [Flavobacteriales bacterium]